jgi:hypothetical protein
MLFGENECKIGDGKSKTSNIESHSGHIGPFAVRIHDTPGFNGT